MLKYHWKIKSSVFFQWKKFIHEKKLEIAKINTMKLHIRDKNLNAKACQWYCRRHLSNSFLSWKKHAKVERNNRYLMERKKNHKKRIEALLSRMSLEKIHNRSKLNSNENIVTRRESHKENFDFLNDDIDLNEDIGDAKMMKMMQDAIEEKMKAYHDQLNVLNRKGNCDTNVVTIQYKDEEKVMANSSVHQKATSTTKPKTSKVLIDNNAHDIKSVKKNLTETNQASKCKNSTSFVTKNMEKRRLERSQRRKALQNRYLQIEKEKKEKALNETIEREREAHHQIYLKRQKQKQIEREKRDVIERNKKKRESARIHFEHVLVARMYQTWATLMAMQRMKQEKVSTYIRRHGEV